MLLRSIALISLSTALLLSPNPHPSLICLLVSWPWMARVGHWYVHFASCFYVDIYCIMGCYYTLYYNTYAFSPLFYKVYMKRENADSWNSGLEKEQILSPILHNSKSPETSRRIVLEYIKNIGRRKHQRGATHCPSGCAPCLVGHLAAPRCPSSAIWSLLP